MKLPSNLTRGNLYGLTEKPNRSLAVLGLVVVLSANVVAQNETTVPGRQVMVAHYTRHAPVIDGVFSARENVSAL